MLLISQSDLDEVRSHGEATYPHECCGVLLGSMHEERNEVKATLRCGNTRLDSPQNRYNIDPRELVRIQRQAHERGLDIVGFYHSHPDHAAQWSQTDFAEAHWIGCSYVITSVQKGKSTETNSFLLSGTGEEDKSFQDEEIQVSASVGLR